ncbi:sensor histidine kinase [Mangrovibacterium lignilyticum]|uniref:sensor histidine kinase n=1 Tax=Mangrovibacterium lignilyticum TaxID=2668052 RepID=UPI0013D44C91|nr:sensor histidine kinase [Mangrovibacterium lignilyticum]
MKKLIFEFWVVLTVVCGFCITSLAQSIEFRKVVPDDGGNFTSVTNIKQDRDGFIWFTTKKGLYKYDGSQLTSFANDPNDPNSLSNNFLLCLHIDDSGIIWTGGLGSGMDRYDPATGKFTCYKHDPNNSGSLANDTINDILRDRYGILWIATQQGLDQYDPGTNTFKHFKSVKSDPATLSDRMARILYEDRQGTLWIGTGSPFATNGGRPEDGGLSRYNRNNGTFTRFQHIPGDEHSLVNNKVSAIYEDRDGILWIGTVHNGLHKMNRENGTFTRILYDPAHPERLSIPEYTGPSENDFIHFITQDTLGGYWLGTKRQGLFYYDPAEGEMHQYLRNLNEETGFADICARIALTSNDGVFWVGSDQGNLYRVNLLSRELPHTKVATAPVNQIFEESDGSFWIGSRKALIRMDKKSGQTKSYGPEINYSDDGATNYGIYSMRYDHEGNLWIGGASGLYRWNASDQTFTGYQHDPKNANSISADVVFSIFEDRNDSLWVATFRGLNLLNRKTGSFKQYWINRADTTQGGTNLITSIVEDKAGKLWTGSWSSGGINQFNPVTGTFRNYLRGFSVGFTFEDSDGALWVGTNKGLFTYNPEIDNFIRIKDFSSDVYSIVEDDHKNLWVGTSDGIVKLNPDRNETSLLASNLGVSDLSRFSGYKAKNGDLYFGNGTGYYHFNPVDFLRKLPFPEIVFSGFNISDQVIHPGKNGPLSKKLQETNEITLKYNQNIFSFDFTIIDYSNPEQNHLLYYLENYDKEWIEANSGRKAYYFNVPPGKYVFHVKGSNGYGVWAEKQVSITILPPWYRSWIAWLTYALIFIGLVFAFDRFQRRRIVRKERQKNQERELAQAKEIEKAYNDLKTTQKQLIQAEKMASLGELTAGIAHEIQNPLNFVNNFSELNSELIADLEVEVEKGNLEEVKAIAKDIKDNEQKINHHGNRADAIVKGMLQHSRAGSGQKEPTDINKLADEYLRLSYHGLRAKDKSFNADFKLEADEKLLKVNVVPQDIGRVLLNLINNAFYAVSEKQQGQPQGYQPRVLVSTHQLDDAVEIKVSDNGSGIPQDVVDKIYQPFFTTKPAGQGTGLGLSMSYDIVTKGHGGELIVESKEGLGTEFKLIIPIAR